MGKGYVRELPDCPMKIWIRKMNRLAGYIQGMDALSNLKVRDQVAPLKVNAGTMQWKIVLIFPYSLIFRQIFPVGSHIPHISCDGYLFKVPLTHQ